MIPIKNTIVVPIIRFLGDSSSFNIDKHFSIPCGSGGALGCRKSLTSPPNSLV